MPKNMNTIVYGKVQISAETPVENLVKILDQVLKKHGYPEMISSSDEENSTGVGMSSIDEIEKEALAQNSSPQIPPAPTHAGPKPNKDFIPQM